jgi:hypothetical protein
MKLTNGDIFTVREPLQKLITEKFPVMVSYKLAKLVNKLNEQNKVIEEVRQGLIKKYGEKDDKGNTQVKQEGENWVKFVGEFNELMSQEIELVIDKVKLPEKVSSTCDSCKHNMDKTYEIDAQTLIALDKFIEV